MRVKMWEFLPGGWAENLTLSEVGFEPGTGRAEPVRPGDDDGPGGVGFVSPADPTAGQEPHSVSSWAGAPLL